MKTFGWAYLGCGSIADGTAAQVIQSGEQKIVAAWNRTRQKAELFSAKYGAVVYDTPEEAIMAPDVEGVYIAVTADKHAELMRLCIRCHKPVLCEKPFTANAKEAEEIFAYAAQEGVYVAEAMWTWYNTPAWQVRDWVHSGALGQIQDVDVAFLTPLLLHPHLPRLMDPAMCGGALLDLGIYPLRYCYELFGMPDSLKCDARMEGGADLGERIELHYDGFTARLQAAFDHPRSDEWCRITGTNGGIDAPDFHNASQVTLALHGQEPVVYTDKSLKYAQQFQIVAQEIRVGRLQSEKVSAQSTIDCMKLMDECRRQMELVYPCED